MRLHCYFCGKSVSSELPDDSVNSVVFIRAMLVCPECIGAARVIIPELPEPEKPEAP